MPCCPFVDCGWRCTARAGTASPSAIVDISEALRIDPSNALYLRSRALSHAAKSDFDRATSDLQAAISRGLKDGNELLRQYEQKRAAAPQQSLVTAPQPSALAPVSAGPRVALVIGNGRYRHATPLVNPANDAAEAPIDTQLKSDVVMTAPRD